MKSKYIGMLLILILAAGCTKTDKLPVSATYELKGDHATFYDNGIPESTGSHLIIVSGGTSYNWSANHDTLFKDLWKGDKLSISAATYTSIFYKSGTQSGSFVVDSSAATQASITVQ